MVWESTHLDHRMTVARQLKDERFQGSCLDLVSQYIERVYGLDLPLANVLLGRDPPIEEVYEEVLLSNGFEEVNEPICPSSSELHLVVFRDRATDTPAAAGVWLDSSTVLTLIDQVRVLTRSDMSRSRRKSYRCTAANLARLCRRGCLLYTSPSPRD